MTPAEKFCYATREKRKMLLGPGEPPAALSSAGLTGVWAEENTRESIFAAFERKETFGTSGTRIKVRMFAGWNYPKDMTVYDVVWSGDRKADLKTGKVPAVGNTVDVKTATYKNDIGTTELIGEWTDPAFDPKAHATYYARVLEIPTPRWSTY